MTDLKYDSKKLEELCKKYKIDFLGVFGSTARGDDKADSDVDLLVRFENDAKIGFFELVNVEEQVERLFGRRVDLVPEGGVSPYIEPYIMKDLVTIYGSA